MLFPGPSLLALSATFIVVNGQSQGRPLSDYANPPAQNFTQTYNHGVQNSKTFQQLYQLDTTHFKPGGPILFHQSEESPMIPLKDNIVSDYAPQLGGISCTLEHRFFGYSYPEGIDPSNVTSAQYKEGLTLDNILQDGVEFVNWIRKTVPGAEKSPVIYTGGSYGGFLTVQARIRHPDTFFGGLAFSPPLASLGSSYTLEQNPLKFAASDFLANLYWDLNGVAAHKMQQALNDVTACSATNSCSTAMPELNLCEAPVSADDWLNVIQGVIVQAYALIAQLNFDVDEFFPANMLQKLINATASATSSGAVLRIPIDIGNNIDPTWANYTKLTESNCSDWVHAGANNNLRLTVGSSFAFVGCNWFPISEQAISPNNSIFPTFWSDQPTTQCKDGWADATTFNLTNQEWQEMYNTTDNDLDKVTNLLILHGTYDRTLPLGWPNLTPSNNRSHSTVIVTTGLGHIEHMYSNTVIPPGINKQLDEVRETQLSYLQEWLGIWNLTEGATNSSSSGSGPSNNVTGASSSSNSAPDSTVAHSGSAVAGLVAMVAFFSLAVM